MDQTSPVGTEPTGTSVEQKIDQLALAVKRGFDAVDERFAGIDEQLTAIRTAMVTKAYLDDKLADLKGDLVGKLRKEDEKLNFVIGLLRARSVLSEEDVQHIRAEFPVFPSLP